MKYTATDKFLKRAWIRTPGHPVGQPAPGRINCPCGQAPETMLQPETGDIHCPCGIVYTWDGWIKEGESAQWQT